MSEKSEKSYILLKADFHVHSTFSDGYYTPTQLVALYANKSYDVIALTDHDTVEGYGEARLEGERLGLIIIKGEEISCQFPDKSFKHILALFIETTIQIDWKAWRTMEVQTYFDLIHQQGGLGIVAHAWQNWSSNWKSYQNASYIDGWEYTPWQCSSVQEWLFQFSNKIYLLNHDFQGDSKGTSESQLSSYYTVILAHNRTLEGAREALNSRRTVAYSSGKYYGNPYVIALLIQNERWDVIRRG